MSAAVTVLNADGKPVVVYEPQPHQEMFHASNAPNLLALGTRDTGKSTALRWDAIIRCLTFSGFKALIIRRMIPDLRISHLQFIGHEVAMLGGEAVGRYRQTTTDVVWANGSVLQFSHCEKMSDIERYLSSEWDYIGFDELPTFPLEMFLKISGAARSPLGKPYIALVRACGNPLGAGAGWMKQWFVDKNPDPIEYPDYAPDDFEMIFSTLDENKYSNRKQYEKRLRNMPEHVRRAWLLGEFVIEGAYFSDFCRKKSVNGDIVDWHTIHELPTWKDKFGGEVPLLALPWIKVYRSVDWGYFPDPWVCHWHLVLPNKRKITFKERHNTRMLAADVAQLIKRESEGMSIVETACDPTMFIKTGNAPYSIAEIFEQNGVPLTPAQNDRELYGYSIHEGLNTMIDGTPQWQIVEPACPELVRTLPVLLMDPNDPRKIANGPDHWAISCAYFMMSQAPPSRDPGTSAIPFWMRPKAKTNRIVVG